MEYAKHYGRALLTEPEWRYSYSYHLNKYLEKQPENQKKGPQPAINMMHDTPDNQPETPEIKILDGMGLKIKEWVSIAKTKGSEQIKDLNLFSGVIEAETLKTGSKSALRQQWEGFPDVGFRTKIHIK